MSEVDVTMIDRTPIEAALAELRGAAEAIEVDPDAGTSLLNRAIGDLERAVDVVLTRKPMALPSAEMLVGEHRYWRNAEGALIPVEAIRPADALEDEVVRKIVGYAIPLSEQIGRFWEHSRADIAGFVDLVLQQYEAARGGRKGNITLSSYDDMFKVELRVARLIHFGADLQAAKALTDECLAGWSEQSGAEIRTIVRSAFNVDKDGRVNQQALLSLLRHNFEDERWKRAMDAIRDAIRVRATKEYLRFWQRPAQGKDWQAITIDLAQA